MIRYLSIQFFEIPVRKIFTLGNEDYEFVFQHNKQFDFVTVQIEKDLEILHVGKLVYGNNLLSGNLKIPFTFLPISDEDLNREGYSNLKVTSETLGKNIQIYYDDGL